MFWFLLAIIVLHGLMSYTAAISIGEGKNIGPHATALVLHLGAAAWAAFLIGGA